MMRLTVINMNLSGWSSIRIGVAVKELPPEGRANPPRIRLLSEVSAHIRRISFALETITVTIRPIMNISIGEVIIWIIVGGFAGSVVGAIVTRKREGYGRWKNLGIGLVGAVIGGVLFKLFKIDLGFGELRITFEDILSAMLSSFILLVAIWMIGKRQKAVKKTL